MNTTKESRETAYDRVNAAILAALEKGIAPWTQPWLIQGQRNATTNRPYRGINPMTLAAIQAARGYEDSRWLTYKQAQTIGGHVKKGAKSAPVVFGKTSTWSKKVTNEDGTESEEQRGGFMWRMFYVFSVEEIEGVNWEKGTSRTPEEIPTASAIWDGYAGRPSMVHGGDRAYYSPLGDRIQMPPRKSFITDSHYYETLFHEAAHSTGHKDRLGRLGSVENLPRFGSEDYSREELVAEMTAAFLMGTANLDAPQMIQQSAAYLSSWAKKIKDDPRMLLTAGAQAQKAADYILGATPSE